MNILFLMIIPINIGESPNLYTDLMEEFRDRGHHVYAMSLREKKYDRPTELTVDHGIQVLHVRTGNMFGVGAIEKGLTTISLAPLFIRAINRYFADVTFDLVVMPTPPITFTDVVTYIKKRDQAVAYLILRDIFPQNAKDIGLLNNQIVFSLFRRKEKQMYDCADYIGCMSQGNIEYVKQHNPEVALEKLELLPNWGSFSDDTPRNKEKEKHDIRNKYQLRQSFIGIFGGNIGWPQELSFLLELAVRYQNRADILFLIVGKGVLKEKMDAEIKEKKLTNVKMMDFVPREDYNALIRACDVGFINLDHRFTIPNIPSKTLGYFSAQIPILAAVDPCTDYGKLLDEAHAGFWCLTGDLEDYQKKFERLLSDKDLREKMGRNGCEYAQRHLTTERACQTILRHRREQDEM